MKQRSFDALGIATFGPVDPRTSSKTYGHITKTPKKLWRDADVVGALDIFGVPVKFDTDVNAPALSEYRAMIDKGEDPTGSQYSCTGMWGPYNLEIVDKVQLPETLPAGEYVLGFRYDCEESNQIWASCSDVTVTREA